MTKPTRFREIEVGGSPREMGRQHGAAARDEIRDFVAIALESVNKTILVSRDRAMAVAARCIDAAEEYSRDMVDELQGVSESTQLSLEEIMLLQIRNQLKPDSDAACTSFSIGGSATLSGNGIVAQNWDNDPALDPFTVVLTRRPTNKPAMMTVTQTGLIA